MAHNRKCERCGSRTKVELHHILPVSMGGTDTPDNHLWLCRCCHVKEHSEHGHWSIWGQNGGRKTAHESAPLRWLFHLAQFRDDPKKRREYVQQHYPHLMEVYVKLEVNQ